MYILFIVVRADRGTRIFYIPTELLLLLLFTRAGGTRYYYIVRLVADNRVSNVH